MNTYCMALQHFTLLLFMNFSMSHPEFFLGFPSPFCLRYMTGDAGAQPHKRGLKGAALPQGVQGSPCRGLGCPQKLLFFFLAACGGKKEEGKFQGGTPIGANLGAQGM